MTSSAEVSHETSDASLPSVTIPVGVTFDTAERTLLAATLDATGWNKPHAAQVLGCALKTVYNLVHRYRLKPPKRPAILPRSAA